MTTLTTAPLAPLLDRLFSEAEASGSMRRALAQISPGESAALLTSANETDYRRFYSVAKDAYPAVSRDTAQLLYMLVRATGARLGRRVWHLVWHLHPSSRGRPPGQRRWTAHHDRVRAVEGRAGARQLRGRRRGRPH